jgi:hypothetical protein
VSAEAPTHGIRRENTLCLSGAGYRAALFHLGALTRLNELGMLTGIETVGAAGGGSILAALLATRVPWPLRDCYPDWPAAVAKPMRGIARDNPIPTGPADAAVEEGFARELVDSGGEEADGGPRFVFGAAGLTLGEMGRDGEDDLRWEIGGSVGPTGYDSSLVDDVISAVRTDLDSFSEAEQAVLENHGYLLADAAARRDGRDLSAVHPPAVPPHPAWMDEAKVRLALAASSRRTRMRHIRVIRVLRRGY